MYFDIIVENEEIKVTNISSFFPQWIFIYQSKIAPFEPNWNLSADAFNFDLPIFFFFWKRVNSLPDNVLTSW